MNRLFHDVADLLEFIATGNLEQLEKRRFHGGGGNSGRGHFKKGDGFVLGVAGGNTVGHHLDFIAGLAEGYRCLVDAYMGFDAAEQHLLAIGRRERVVKGLRIAAAEAGLLYRFNIGQ